MKRMTLVSLLALACMATGAIAAMTNSASEIISPSKMSYVGSGNSTYDPVYLFCNEVEGYLEGTGVFPSISIIESTGATYYTKLQGGNQSANLTYTLPTAYGTTGYVLSATDAGVMSWIANGGTFAGGSITSDITMANGKYIFSDQTTAHASGIQAWDTTSTASYTNVLGWTNGAVPAIVLGVNTSTLAIVSSTGLNVSATGAVTGVSTLAMTDDLSLATGKAIKSSTTIAETGAIQVYDTDTGPAFKNVLQWTNGTAPAIVIGSANGPTTITTSDWGIDATGAATGIASVQFDSGTTIYCTSVAVSNAEVKTLYSSPKVLVAAPGTHNFIDVVSVVLIYDYSVAAFNTASNNITIEYKTDASGPTATSAISQAGFLDQTADGIGKLIPVAVANQVVAAVENQPVVLYCATADPTTGSGVVRAMVSYRVMPTGL